MEPDQTAESYTTGLRQKYMIALMLVGTYILLYVVAWCVIGGMKRRMGQIRKERLCAMLFLCAEHWTAPHHNGYVEGWLKESDLLLIDLSCGEILFQDKAGENEFSSPQMEQDAISISLEKKKAKSCLA